MRPAQLQNVAVIDLREPSVVLGKLHGAAQRFEKGGPAPVAIRGLLDEVAGGLADSGPLELGVSSRSWLGALSTANAALANLQGRTPTGQRREVARALRKLRRFLRRASWSARWRRYGAESRCVRDSRRVRNRLIGLLVLVSYAASVLVVVAIRHRFQAALDLALALLVVPFPLVFGALLLLMEARWRLWDAADAREVLEKVGPTERGLFASWIGDGRVVIATDRGVLVATHARPHGLLGPAWSGSARVERARDYAEISSVSSGRVRAKNSDVIRVQLNTKGAAFSIDMEQAAGAEALVAITNRRAHVTGAALTDLGRSPTTAEMPGSAMRTPSRRDTPTPTVPPPAAGGRQATSRRQVSGKHDSREGSARKTPASAVREGLELVAYLAVVFGLPLGIGYMFLRLLFPGSLRSFHGDGSGYALLILGYLVLLVVLWGVVGLVKGLRGLIRASLKLTRTRPQVTGESVALDPEPGHSTPAEPASAAATREPPAIPPDSGEIAT
jgi:hypothetical protein